jgi:hypothetical protein
MGDFEDIFGEDDEEAVVEVPVGGENLPTTPAEPVAVELLPSLGPLVMPVDPNAGPNSGNRGNPGKLTPLVRAAVLEMLGESQSRRTVCAIIGVSMNTLANWAKRDPTFRDEMRAAEQSGIRDAVKCLRNSAKFEWKAAVEYLARNPQSREDWAKREGVTVAVSKAKSSKEARAEIQQLLLQPDVEPEADDAEPMPDAAV